MKKGIVLATLALGFLLLGTPTQTASAAPDLQGGMVSNSVGVLEDTYLASTLSFVNLMENGGIFHKGNDNELQPAPNLTKLLPIILIVVAGGAGMVLIAGVAVAGMITWTVLKKRQAYASTGIEPPFAEAVNAWQQNDRHLNRPARQSRRHLEQLKAQQKKARVRRQKELIEGHINVDLADAQMYTSFGHGFERVSRGLEYVKSGADFVIDTFADINPGTGKLTQTGYKIGAGLGEEVSESMQEPGNWFSHLTRGTAKGLLDVGVDRLKNGMVNGLPPQLREHVIFRGARMDHDPLRLPSFLELPGRPAALQRGIFNAALTRGTDQVNALIWARGGLKHMIHR